MLEFQGRLNWQYLSIMQQMSSEFMGKTWGTNLVDFSYICAFQKLSREFISEFMNVLLWRCVIRYQHVDEGMIRDYGMYIHCWKDILQYQQVSDEFIQEFKHKFDKEYVPLHTMYLKIDEIFVLKETNGFF